MIDLSRTVLIVQPAQWLTFENDLLTTTFSTKNFNLRNFQTSLTGLTGDTFRTRHSPRDTTGHDTGLVVQRYPRIFHQKYFVWLRYTFTENFLRVGICFQISEKFSEKVASKHLFCIYDVKFILLEFQETFHSFMRISKDFYFSAHFLFTAYTPYSSRIFSL